MFFLNRRSDGDIKVVELIKRKFSVDLVVNKFYFDIKKCDGKSYFLWNIFVNYFNFVKDIFF